MKTITRWQCWAAAMTAYLFSGAMVPAAVLHYSSFLGGAVSDEVTAAAADGSGCLYVAGYSVSSEFPVTAGGYQTVSGGGIYTGDVFVTKVSPSGSALIYSTFLGGVGDDLAGGIAVDQAGNAYLAGLTGSDADFPVTAGAYDADFNGGDIDAFVAELNPSGSALVYSTYLGGSDSETNITSFCDGAIALDPLSGCVYVAGMTWSSDFPVTGGAYDTDFGGSGYWAGDGYVAKLQLAGNGQSDLLAATFLGGEGDDWTWDIAMSGGAPFIVGTTDSAFLPSPAFGHPPVGDENYGYQGFLVKMDSDLSGLSYGGYIGGYDGDEAFGVAADSAGQAFVTGVGAPQPGDDSGAYVVKVNASGTGFLYRTVFAGTGADYSYDIAIDGSGNAFVTGLTDSSDFQVTPDAYDTGYNGGASDSFLGCVGSNGAILYSTYFGGSGSDTGRAISVSGGGVYLGGSTSSVDFPILNAYQPSIASDTGDKDAFFAKFFFGSPRPEHYDFDGDGASDAAIFRPSTGLWTVRNVTRVYFGGANDIPAPGDYNGDGTTEIAVYKPSSGVWAIRNGSRIYFGGASDLPVAGDYNGDGVWEAAIRRPSNGLWSVRGVTQVYLGNSTDLPCAGDYDGDGRKDIGVYRPSQGMWSIHGVSRYYLGNSTDSLVPGDYAGGGRWRPGIFRPSTGLWSVLGGASVYFGNSSHQAVPADYDGSGTDDTAVFQSSTGSWSVRSLTRFYLGQAGDIPVAR